MLNYHVIEESYRYLGLIVNHMLIFDHHVDDIKKKEKGTIIDAMGSYYQLYILVDLPVLRTYYGLYQYGVAQQHHVLIFNTGP